MDDLRQMENAKNYNNWLYELISPYIGKRVLEIGPGIGNISQKLINDVELLVGVEPNPYCVDQLAKKMDKTPGFILINKRLEDCGYDLLKRYKFDTVLCMNVLEHIEDDEGTLLFFEKLLEPGGRVVLLVPAFPQVYGPIDLAVGHFRRYTKSSIKYILAKTPLIVERNFYSNFLGLLGWFYNARIRKSSSQDNSQIKLFNKITPILSAIEKKFGCLMGLSLISVSKKKNE
jgi:2-polyprenyl-3-methyl-5-hydroxy-6-metoxy-1,4-benzoquinol methylase